MAKGTTNAPDKPRGASSKLMRLIAKVTWYELLAIPFIAVGAAIFWFRDEIADAFWTAQKATIEMLGLGIVPLGLWTAAFIATLIFQPRLFRHVKAWLASALTVVLTFGVLSLFRPMHGTFAPFTLGGYVSLGGLVGEAIAGSALWQRVLRLGGLAALTLLVISPASLLLFAVMLGRIFTFGLVALALAGKGIASLFKRKPRDPEEAQDDADGAASYDEQANSEFANSYDTHHSAYSDDDSARPRSKFAEAIASTDDEGALDDSEVARHLADYLGLPEREDTEMQANTDFDYGFANTANGAALADADNFDFDREHANGYANGYTNGYANGHDLADFDSADDSLLDEINGIVSAVDAGEDDDGADFVVGMQDIEDLNSQSSAEMVEDDEERASYAVRLLGRNRADWDKPSIQLLEGVQERGIPEEQIRETAETIRQALADYDIEVEIGSIKYGPTVTMYGIIPGWNRKYQNVKMEDEFGNPIKDQNGKQITKRQEVKTRVSVQKILAREKDLSLALRTPSLRIETPVMGKAQVGIEIPNEDPAPVTLRAIMESPEYRKLRKDADLPVALGKGTGGENIALDLAKMPHLLIAGATGAGKSVALNAIVAGLLMERSPAELRMLLVDPKRVELTPYNGIPHLLCPVIVEVDEVVGMLKGVINEMMNRYRLMEDLGVRNIEAYNKRVRDDKMPFLLVVVDELADLMMTAAFDVEQSLCRLAQLGRATGIHLILATQRPSVDVVTGLIKANFPSRVSFGVTSHIDSRTILDTNGAEKLLGKGDMLYLPRDAARPLRAQGAFISDTEIDRLINHWQTTPRGWVPNVDLRPVSENEDDDDEPDASSSTDAMFDKAVELARTQKKLSTSLLQRRLRIGYPRAARLMDELEECGVVSASDGAKSRDVIISGTA